MQQHEWLPIVRAFGIIQLHFTGIEGALDEPWMIFAHNLVTICYRLGAAAS